MREPLRKELRGKLERTIINARDMAEAACRNAITHLGVDRAEAESHLSKEERTLRERLRAHGRSLGDERLSDGRQELSALISECAYEQWHRMLFARFLAENGLLIHPDHGVSVTLSDCEDLAKDEGARSRWEVAGRFAGKILPQVFRAESPALELKLSREDIHALERLLEGLDSEVFKASDSLGWVYQFWQSRKKEEVNESEVKIGSGELSAVTQLFTEPYMVSFLLDNSLGAWWARKRLSPEILASAPDEDSLRHAAALPGVPLSYLRFVKEGNSWKPAAGWFEAWPKHVKELKVLDPCCGSGHFLVAAFEMLVAMRAAEESIPTSQAIDSVLKENLFGLELDSRCVEIAAFALAFSAWRYPGIEGYRILPGLNVACSGLPVRGTQEEWEALGGKNKNLRLALGWLYKDFKDAPILGSLIQPVESNYKGLADWDTVMTALSTALDAEGSDDSHEAGIVARGLATAAKILISRHHLVITNVPYLARGKQCERLRDFCDNDIYGDAKNDLATVFLERCLRFCVPGGTTSIVLPQNWLFLSSYRKFREKLLKRDRWHLIARMGEHGFDSSAAAGAFTALITISREESATQTGGLFAGPGIVKKIRGIDASELKTPADKATLLLSGEIHSVEQKKQLENPDAVVALVEVKSERMLSEYAIGLAGVLNGDTQRFEACFWEVLDLNRIWEYEQSSVSKPGLYGGRHKVILWEGGNGQLRSFAKSVKERLHDADTRGNAAWGKSAVGISQMRDLPATLYTGNKFDTNVAVILPKSDKNLLPIWTYCSSFEYGKNVRKLSQKLNVTNATLVKVPFDLEYWTKVAQEKYPNGLPKPYSDDPTQWIFHGHPAHSTSPLQVAVARLAGYKWPAETDEKMELSSEARELIAKVKNLDSYADTDGIVSLTPLKGEASASERLDALLRAAFGSDFDLPELIRKEGYPDWTLEEYLRDKFFEDHCKVFLHRPFIWQVWDGHRDGFSALINYHKLDAAALDKLIYSYLSTYIHRLEAAKDTIEDSAAKIVHAKRLKENLEKIKEGEAPFDIFVRWKKLAEQPLGWNPDLNDGVRMNIRPWMTAGVLRHNKPPKLNIKWDKDRGKDVESAPWYKVFKGERINDHHTTLAEKREARDKK